MDGQTDNHGFYREIVLDMFQFNPSKKSYGAETMS